MAINPYIQAPKPPHGFVDTEDCICGAKYSDYRAFGETKSSERFARAAKRLRISFGGYENGGGYRGRGTILYMLRVMKLQEWYEEHYGCESMSEQDK